MLRLTLAQMRRNLGRLVAAGIAIAIGTGFVAATLLAGNLITRTSYDALSASFADADLVVKRGQWDTLTSAEVAALAELPEVASLHGVYTQWFEIRSPEGVVYPEILAVPDDPSLQPQVVVEGALPAADDQVTLPAPAAARLEVGVGDTVTLQRELFRDLPAGEAVADGGTWESVTEELVVSGLTEDPTGAFTGSGGAALVTAASAERWFADAGGAEIAYDAALVRIAGEVGLETARAALTASVPADVTVRTKDEAAAAQVRQLTGETNALMVVVLGFASVALLVAGLVIANTFQVLVAQRIRTLALLRCVGAQKRQLRGSVLLEASILGVGASLAGVLLGTGLAQATLLVLGETAPDVPLPATVVLSPAVVLVPLVVGTLVTLVSALAPAAAATRVAPLAALRPQEAPTFARGAGRARLVWSVVLVVAGAALLGGGALAGQEDPMVGLAAGVLGGALSVVGVLIGAVLWVPRVVGLLGRTLTSTGTSAKLATANTVRNPRRTAATSAALLIGVTLVAMMSTGAASARETLGEELRSQFPVDLAVAAPWGTDGPEELSPSVVRTVAETDGVAAVATVRSFFVTLGGQGEENVTEAMAGDDALGDVLLDRDVVEGLRDDTVLLRPEVARWSGVEAGDEIALQVWTWRQDGTGAALGQEVTRTVVVGETPGVVMTLSTLDELDAPVPVTAAWARVSDGSAASTVADVQDALSDTAVQISGAVLERVRFENIVDTLLAVVLGLLAAAIVIAVIGVANTLSLSVMERRRESATLRAIGLTRRQLRGTLAIEGMLIAGVGAVVGVALGLAYGWAGTAAVLGSAGEVRLGVPWRDLALVLLAAVVAGLLASVLPGRSAVRTSPVEALAVE